MFDSHAHVMDSQFDEDRGDVIDRAHDAGVLGWLEVGTDLEQSKSAIDLAKKVDGVWATIGVHPSDIQVLDSSWNDLESLAVDPYVKAIGEIGLDLYRGGNLEEQKSAVRRFIKLAHKHALPVVFHVRSGKSIDCHGALIEILESYEDAARPLGVIHTYSGTLAQAKRYIELGMYLSVSGVITFRNAGGLIDVVREVRMDRILIETDCPFLAPEPHRGTRNEPANVSYVARAIARIRNLVPEEVISRTEENARRLFSISS